MHNLVTISLKKPAPLYIEYTEKVSGKKFRTVTSPAAVLHHIHLLLLKANTEYTYRIIIANLYRQKSELLSFKTRPQSPWLENHWFNEKHPHVDYSGLTNKLTGEKIPVSAFTCFNTEGTDVTGTVFKKDCSVAKGKIQALWIGAMLPEHISSGDYTGTVTVSAANAASKTVTVTVHISENLIANHARQPIRLPTIVQHISCIIKAMSLQVMLRLKRLTDSRLSSFFHSVLLR